jgi:hypothetical protein
MGGWSMPVRRTTDGRRTSAGLVSGACITLGNVCRALPSVGLRMDQADGHWLVQQVDRSEICPRAFGTDKSDRESADLVAKP